MNSSIELLNHAIAEIVRNTELTKKLKVNIIEAFESIEIPIVTKNTRTSIPSNNENFDSFRYEYKYYEESGISELGTFMNGVLIDGERIYIDGKYEDGTFENNVFIDGYSSYINSGNEENINNYKKRKYLCDSDTFN